MSNPAPKRRRKKVTFSLPEKQPEEKPKEFSLSERAYLRNVLRTKDMFLSRYGSNLKSMPVLLKFKSGLKASAEFGAVKDMANEAPKRGTKRSKRKPLKDAVPPKKRKLDTKSGLILDEMVIENLQEEDVIGVMVNEVEIVEQPTEVGAANAQTALTKYGALPAGWTKTKNSSSIVLHRTKRRKPQWHPPWKLHKVLSGHNGWVRAVDVDISNEFFATGSADRTIKIWDLASGDLKLTLTGHTDHVRGVKLSPRHPYLFSVGLDQTVKCWDLTMNKVIRSYHGHLSGVFCVDIHPALDVIMTGGRDSVCRVWDIRTKAQIQVLAGHKNTVASITSQVGDPSVITGSHDNTVRCWDMVAGRPSSVLTHHKKSVRSLLCHPVEYTFASGSGDNIKVWKCPEARFLRNMEKKPPSIANGLAINADDVLVSGHDTGQILFWDWKTGHCFQEIFSTPQSGSIEPEAGVQAVTFDRTGSRLITAETDKAIKIWKEDEEATELSHPVKFKGVRRKVKSVY